MKKAHYFLGKKGAGKSWNIHNKATEFISDGWEIINPSDSPTDERNKDTAIYLLEKEGTKIILNSGSDTYELIRRFKNFLLNHSDVAEVWTAIRPKKKGSGLNKWMKEAISVLGTLDEHTINLDDDIVS